MASALSGKWKEIKGCLNVQLILKTNSAKYLPVFIFVCAFLKIVGFTTNFERPQRTRWDFSKPFTHTWSSPKRLKHF